MTFDLGVPELGRRACVLVVMVMMMLKVVMLMLEMVMMMSDTGDDFKSREELLDPGWRSCEETHWLGE